MDEPCQPAEHVEPLQTISDVTANIACRSCGYNLRGVDREGLCPECGTSVEWSLRGFQLRFADRRWLKKLCRGSQLVVTSMTLLFEVGGIIALFALLPFGTSYRSTVTNILEILGFVWISSVLLMHVTGVWYMTLPEPNVQESRRILIVRRVTRMVTVIAAGYFAIVLVDRDVSHFVFPSLLVIASHFVLSIHLGTLADRTSGKTESSDFRIYQWTLGCVTVIFCLALIPMSTIGLDSDGLACCIVAMIPVAVLTFVGWFFSLQYAVHQSIKRALAPDDDSGHSH